MPKSLSSNLYGTDDTAMASRIAGEALSDTKGQEGVWHGDASADTRARDASVGVSKTNERKEGKVRILRDENAGAGPDGKMDWDYTSRRHRKGPSTAEPSGEPMPKV
jgi:hypothetical protein